MKTPFRGLATHVVAAKRPRRGLLPGATGALATAAPSDLDAQLLWLCSALMALDAEIDCMLADRRSLRRRPGEAPLDEDHLDAAESAWFDLIEEIAGTPARSLTGMRAKAAALQYVLARVTRQSLDSIARGEDDAGQMEDRLALSLTRDLLAVRAVLSR